MQNFISREWKQRFPREFLALKLKILEKLQNLFRKKVSQNFVKLNTS
jgi:hypothetical protein